MGTASITRYGGVLKKIGSVFGGVRGWRLGLGMGAGVAAVVIAAVVAAFAPGDSALPLLYALPVLVAALVMVAPEAAMVALLALVLFLVSIGLNEHAHFFPSILPLSVLCVVALVLSGRHRGDSAGHDLLPEFSPEAGMLGLVASDLAATLDLPALLDAAAQQLSATVGVTRCTITLIEGGRLRIAAAVGMTATPAGMSIDEGPGQRTPLAMEQVLSLREPIVLGPESEGVDAEVSAATDLVRVLALPLIFRGGLVGVATLDEPGRDTHFSAQRISLGMTVASFAALMVNNARLFESEATMAAQLHERSATNEALLRLGNELRVTLDLDAVFETLGRTVLEALGYREVSIFLYDAEADTFSASVSLGGSDELNEFCLATIIPGDVFRRFMEADQRMGNSFFRSRRRASVSKDEEVFFPCTDLGSRGDGEWQTGDSLFTPLTVADGSIIGVLDVYDPVERILPTVDSVRTLEIFANQAGTAIQNARQYERLQAQEARLERESHSQREILSVSESMLGTLDEKVVFDSIADTLAQIVAYDTLAVSKVDWDRREIRTVFARDDYADELMASPLRIDEGLTGWAVAHDEPVLCNDVLADPRGALVAGTPEDEAQASIIVPLRAMGKVIGVLFLDRLGGARFEEEELETVRLFANLAAIAIENASLYERTQVRAVTDSLTGVFDHGHFQETLERETKRCERYGEGFSLLMMDLDHFKAVNDRYGHPRGDEVLKAVAQILSETARESDYVARYGGEEFVLILPRTSSTDGCALAERLRERIAAVPVASGDAFRVSASVGVADFPSCGLDARTVLSAADTALLWAKRRGRNCVLYYRDVREMVVAPLPGDIADGFWTGGLEALAAAVDAKVTFRERHSEAVAGMVRELATAAGCAAAEVDLFEVAARLHDVGKVGISTEILAKSASLSVAELDELKRHVEVGVDILKNADAPRELQPPVRHHHERWDGLGYPDGLCGEDIALGARLIAICDSFQAMLCDRPYRTARTLDEARDEIRRGAGVQFDPRLATVFLESCATSA